MMINSFFEKNEPNWEVLFWVEVFFLFQYKKRHLRTLVFVAKCEVRKNEQVKFASKKRQERRKTLNFRYSNNRKLAKSNDVQLQSFLDISRGSGRLPRKIAMFLKRATMKRATRIPEVFESADPEGSQNRPLSVRERKRRTRRVRKATLSLCVERKFSLGKAKTRQLVKFKGNYFIRTQTGTRNKKE